MCNRFHQYVALTAFVLLIGGCGADVSFFGSFAEAIDNIENAFDEAVADPLNAKPFPVIVGGDNERVFYATNLGDIKLNFPGPGGTVVFPGFRGPSNLYEFQNKQRDLLRPLVPTGAFIGMVTDGRYIAYVSVKGASDALQYSLVAGEIGAQNDRVIFNESENSHLIGSGLALDDGRLAFTLHSPDYSTGFLRIDDLAGIDPTVEIETHGVYSFDLRERRLAYLEESLDGVVRVQLRDLGTDETTLVAVGLDDDFFGGRVILAKNSVVWSESSSDFSIRVMAYDIPTGTVRLWADGVTGALVGATDSHFVSEEYIYPSLPAPERVIIRRYDIDGHSRKLAEFILNGLAGQATVIGDRAAWVNPERKIVLAPLSGGDRISFQPF